MQRSEPSLEPPEPVTSVEAEAPAAKAPAEAPCEPGTRGGSFVTAEGGVAGQGAPDGEGSPQQYHTSCAAEGGKEQQQQQQQQDNASPRHSPAGHSPAGHIAALAPFLSPRSNKVHPDDLATPRTEMASLPSSSVLPAHLPPLFMAFASSNLDGRALGAAGAMSSDLEPSQLPGPQQQQQQPDMERSIAALSTRSGTLGESLDGDLPGGEQPPATGKGRLSNRIRFEPSPRLAVAWVKALSGRRGDVEAAAGAPAGSPPNASKTLTGAKAWDDLLQRHMVPHLEVAVQFGYKKSYLPAVWEPTKSRVLLAWDTLVLLLVMYVAFTAPYEVVFYTAEQNRRRVFNYVLIVLFFLDSLLQCNVAFYNVAKQRMSVLRKDISLRYVRRWVVPDVLSLLPYDAIAYAILVAHDDGEDSTLAAKLKLMQLLRLTQTIRCLRILPRMEMSFPAIDYSFTSITEFVVLTGLLVHLLACIWGLFPQLEGAPVSFLDKYNNAYALANSPADLDSASYHYNLCVYFVTFTLSSVGFGDVVPATQAERYLSVVTILIGTYFFGYVVGSITQIIAMRNAHRMSFHNTMEQLNKFMQDNGITPELKEKLRHYFHYRSLAGNTGATWQGLLEMMSPQLRAEVACETSVSWIKHVRYFCACEDEFLIDMSMTLAPQTYTPREEIFKPGELADRMFIVRRGVVACNGMIYTRGMAFGSDMLEAMFTKDAAEGNGMRTHQAIALTFSDVLILQLHDLVSVLESYPATAKALRRTVLRAVLQEEVRAYTRAVIRMLTGKRPWYAVVAADPNGREKHYFARLKALMPQGAGAAGSGDLSGAKHDGSAPSTAAQQGTDQQDTEGQGSAEGGRASPKGPGQPGKAKPEPTAQLLDASFHDNFYKVRTTKSRTNSIDLGIGGARDPAVAPHMAAAAAQLALRRGKSFSGRPAVTLGSGVAGVNQGMLAAAGLLNHSQSMHLSRASAVSSSGSDNGDGGGGGQGESGAGGEDRLDSRALNGGAGSESHCSDGGMGSKRSSPHRGAVPRPRRSSLVRTAGELPGPEDSSADAGVRRMPSGAGLSLAGGAAGNAEAVYVAQECQALRLELAPLAGLFEHMAAVRKQVAGADMHAAASMAAVQHELREIRQALRRLDPAQKLVMGKASASKAITSSSSFKRQSTYDLSYALPAALAAAAPAARPNGATASISAEAANRDQHPAVALQLHQQRRSDQIGTEERERADRRQQQQQSAAQLHRTPGLLELASEVENR